MNNINNTYFSPLFKKYLKDTEQVKNCGYGQLPFIPYTFPLYETSQFKAFYIGRDTSYWCEYNDKYIADPELYLKDSKEFVTIDQFQKDWNKTGSFWGMVGKLHLQLLTGKYHKNLDDLTEKDWELLNSVGYGNLYSIELPETLKKKMTQENHTELDDIKDWEGYNKLRLAAKSFENLKTIFEAYGEPDVIFVLSWVDKADFFDGVDYEWKAEGCEENFRSVFLSKTHKTKVIWTSHPTRYSFLQTNPQEMCQYLCDTFNSLNA